MASVLRKAKDRGKSKSKAKSTSPTQAYLRSAIQVSHLDGLSHIHALDVAGTYAKLTPSLVATALAEAALMESFFHGSGPRAELVTNIWFGDAGAGFVSPDDHNGDPVIMPGADWQEMIMRADAKRFQWRDSSQKSRGAIRAFDSIEAPKKNGAPPFDCPVGESEPDVEDNVQIKKGREMSGQLSKIYARLPAWVATAALDENVDRKTLVEAVAEVAKAFQLETGRRVIGANIHVETSHDIHVHFTHTDVVPEKILIKKDYKKYTLEKKVASDRKVAAAALLKRGILKPSTDDKDAERAVMYSKGQLDDPVNGHEIIEYRKLVRPKSARERLLSMGPGFCSKTALWEASNRDPAVVKMNARKSTYSFENRVISKLVKLPGSEKALEPEDIYLDYWLWRRWTHEVVSKLSEITQNRLPETAKEYVARYIQFGDSLPNPAMAEATDKAETRVLQKLNSFRLTGEGKDPLHLEKGKKTVDGLLEVFSDILKKKESNALMRGLKKAYRVVFPAKVPTSATPEEVEHEITQGIQGMMSSAIAVAWKSVLEMLAPGQEPKHETPETTQKEVRIAITRRITRGINAALKSLGGQGKPEDVPPELPDVTELPEMPSEADELDENVELAAEAFKQRANHAALEFALTAIKGTRNPDHGSLGIDELQAELEREIKPFRDGLQSATRTLVEGIVGRAVANSSPDPMVAVRNRVRDLNDVEKLTQRLLGDLRKNPHKLDLSSLGRQAFVELAIRMDNLQNPEEAPKVDTPKARRMASDLKTDMNPPM